MEINDSGAGPIEIIEMENAPGELEVEDLGALLPGSFAPMILNQEEAEQARETDWENDNDHGKFIIHIRKRLDNIPTHSGNTTVGCEKAIAFLKRLDREISKAIQSDEKNVISEDEAEEIRDTIIEFVHQLEEAHEKLMSSKKTHKKSSVWIGKEIVARLNDGMDFQYFLPVIKDGEEELMKVAIAEPNDEQVQKFVEGEDISNRLTKEGGTAKIVLFTDPFMQAITRILINSHVSAGRNMEDVYDHLDKKYSFNKREKLSIQEILMQKGFPIFKDFGLDGEEADPTRGTGIEFQTIYPA